jgi:homogentisate 1,2-dioxygenase
MSDLPTIEQCQAFLATINRGRVAIGLDPLDVLDFHGAVPDSNCNCLSARNLFTLSADYPDATVMPVHVNDADPRLCVVLDYCAGLPESITAVTAEFDACADGFGPGVRTDKDRLRALRTRMVAAGVVAP